MKRINADYSETEVELPQPPHPPLPPPDPDLLIISQEDGGFGVILAIAALVIVALFVVATIVMVKHT